MTREQAIKYAAEIKALQEGRVIQRCSNAESNWIDDPDPRFCLCCQFRIKPEPREWIAAVYPLNGPDGLVGGLFNSKEAAKRSGNCEGQLVHVREVVE